MFPVIVNTAFEGTQAFHRHLRLVYSLADPPLVSARAVGIPKASTMVITETVLLYSVLPVIAVAILCAWAIHCFSTPPEPALVHESAPEPAPVLKSTPEPTPAHGSAPESAPVCKSDPEPAPVHESDPVPSPSIEYAPDAASVLESAPGPTPVFESDPEPTLFHEYAPASDPVYGYNHIFLLTCDSDMFLS